MRVLFIHPPSTRNLNYISHAGIVLPSGIAALSAWLRREFGPANIEIGVIEGHARNLGVEEIVREATRKDWDAYLLSYWTAFAMQAYAVSDRLKRLRPNTPIVHGGVHASLVPEDALPHADYVVLGEGEITLAELLRALGGEGDPRRVRGIAYRENGSVRLTETRPLLENLDDTPFPAYDLLDLEPYFRQVGENIMHVVGGPRFPLYPSRGCPFDCAYCCSPAMWRRKVRWRSPAGVIAEMRRCIEEYGISSFHFWDDNSMLGGTWMEHFCRELLDSGLKTNWVALTRAETIIKHREILPLMRRAGCLGLEIGIESTSEKALEAMDKGQTLVEIEEALRLQRQAGLHALYTLMAFSPGEDLTSFWVQNRTMDRYFNGSRFPALYLGQFATTYPGTRFFREAPREGMVLARDWNDHHHDTVNFAPFSLLRDVPVRTRRILPWSGAAICLAAMFRIRYEVFDLEQPPSRLRRNLAGHWKRLRWFYRRCDGTKTIADLGEEMQRIFPIEDRFEGIRFCCVAALLLACLGLIKSANNPHSIRAIHRGVFLYYLANLFNPHYLKTLGRLGRRAFSPRTETGETRC
ncbi:MAG TPA: radical SAM protein [bacterium]|nr:radical SAM protein [bacterium]HPQ66921.1 radical SAM protein [bacterium]